MRLACPLALGGRNVGRKQSGLNYQGPSGHWVQDDRTGFAVRAYNARKEWTQAIVNADVWEARQPQDFVRGVKDDQTIYDPRPEAQPVWDGPLYYTTNAAAAVLATVIVLQATTGLSNGSTIGVMMDNGSFFPTTVSGTPTTTNVTLAHALPCSVASGNQVVSPYIS